MPNPAKYKNTEEGYKHYMSECMHTTLHMEKKDKDQAVAQCLNMWRKEHGHKKPGKAPKKMAQRIAEQFLGAATSPEEIDEMVYKFAEDYLKEKAAELGLLHPETFRSQARGDVTLRVKDRSEGEMVVDAIKKDGIKARYEHIDYRTESGRINNHAVIIDIYPGLGTALRSKKTAAQFIDPFPGIVPERKLTQNELVSSLREAIAAEEEATHFYTLVADATDNEAAKKVLLDIANEERVHIGEFQALLDVILPEEQSLLDEGAKEVQDKK